MKNKFILFFILLSNFAISQTIVENKVDDFTGEKIVSTSWETINVEMTGRTFARFKSIGDSYFFEVKRWYANEVTSSNKDDFFMLKLEGGDLVKLKNTKYSLSCKGCGVNSMIGASDMGIWIKYSITKEDIYKLATNEVEKVRIYLSDGYDELIMKKKKKQLLKNLALKFLNAAF